MRRMIYTIINLFVLELSQSRHQFLPKKLGQSALNLLSMLEYGKNKISRE